MTGIVEVDVHGMNQIQAQIAIDAALRRANASVYRIRIIHGYTHRTSCVSHSVSMPFSARCVTSPQAVSSAAQ